MKFVRSFFSRVATFKESRVYPFLTIAIICILFSLIFYLEPQKYFGNILEFTFERTLPSKKPTKLPSVLKEKLTELPEIKELGRFFVIQTEATETEGDLWEYDITGKKGINRIDRDKIVQFQRSKISQSVAYTLITEEQQEVGDPGQKETITLHKRQLMLANSKGSFSQQVATSVDDWGWIPNTNLLWYETATVQRWFGWGYFGDGNIWIYNPATERSEKILTLRANMQLLAKWSPDGNHLMFVKNDTLTVFNRQTFQQKELLDLPYVGGDRGGPQPIPAFYWSADSTTIYTAFTPKVFDENPSIAGVNLNDQHAMGLSIPVDGTPPKELFTPFLSSVLNDENTPVNMFLDDFTKVLLPRVSQAGITTTSDLILYDLTEQQEYLVQKEYQSVSQYGYPERENQVTHAWISGDVVYYTLVEELSSGYRLNFIKANYKTQEYSQFSTIPLEDFPQVVHFSEQDAALWFTASDTLFFLNEAGLLPVIEGNVARATFYPEEEHQQSELEARSELKSRGINEYKHEGRFHGFSILIPSNMSVTTQDPKIYQENEKLVHRAEIWDTRTIDYYTNLFTIRMGITHTPASEALSAFDWSWDHTAVDPVAQIEIDGVTGQVYHTADGEAGIFPVTTIVLEQGEYSYILIFTTNDYEDSRITSFLKDFRFLHQEKLTPQ